MADDRFDAAAAAERLMQMQNQGPVMPEEYDRGESPVAPYARAFGAGAIDPMGLPSWLMNAILQSPNSDWYMRRMQEARDESPLAAGMGSALLPAGGALAAGRVAGALTANDVARFPWTAALGIGGSVGTAMRGDTRKRRPQAAYPPGGAY